MVKCRKEQDTGNVQGYPADNMGVISIVNRKLVNPYRIRNKP